MPDQLLAGSETDTTPTAESPQSVTEDTQPRDVFYIDEIDAVPADSLLTMRC